MDALKAVILATLRTIFVLQFIVLLAANASAQERTFSVLWWNANPDEPGIKVGSHRKAMATYLNAIDDGRLFNVRYAVHRRRGDLSAALAEQEYDVLVLDATEARTRFDSQDLAALKQMYASGRDAIMLDGTLNIRNVNYNATTQFPGENNATGGLLVNQVASLAQRGGGILIGSDHDMFQASANAALTALVPGARFSGLTDPSTDGDFLGRILLSERMKVRPMDLLRHWQSIPNQGETPTGTFTDFLGRSVTFHVLVEAADKPGGGKRRPYISASFDPGSERTAIDRDTAAFDDPVEDAFEEEAAAPRLPDNMPTRKGGKL